MNRYSFLTFLVIIIGCQTDQTINIDEELKSFFQSQGIDKRTSYIDVDFENGILVGKAENQELIDDFVVFLSNENKQFKIENKIEVIQPPTAYIRNSVANARSEPKHSAELSTQYLMGQKVKLIDMDRSGDWFYIQGPDNYLAWIDSGGIITEDEVSEVWLNAEKVSIAENELVARSIENQAIATDLVFGNILGKTKEGFITPAGIKISLPTTSYSKTENEISGSKVERVLNKAYSLMGRPYLWGGTSTKGMDCSGFTRIAFMNANYLLGRDASLQVHEGLEIDKNDMSKWEKGDLLFFGTLREDGSQRITHVAIHTGNGNIIHASERVREESLNPKSELFNKKRAETLLRVKRFF